MPRFAILEHVGAPDDPAGWHLDLLLENGPACRTWRLMAMPEPGGPAMAAVELPAHRLAWLETIEADVSGGRGRVRRVDAGTFDALALDADSLSAATLLVLRVTGDRFDGRLRLSGFAEGWAASLTATRL